MPNAQYRLPGLDWRTTSTKPPRSAPSAPQGTPLQTAAQIATRRTANIPPGPGFTPPPRQPPAGGGPPQPNPPHPQTGFPSSMPQMGTSFATKGIGRYFNSGQFNTAAVKRTVENGVQAFGEAQYFRHSGFGAALRHTLGMPQMPSHMNDYLRARHNPSTRGSKPGSIAAQIGSSDPDDYAHW